MLQQESRCTVADNSGAKQPWSSGYWAEQKRYASVGDKVVVTVENRTARQRYQKGSVSKAIVVRTSKGAPQRRFLHPL